MLLLQILAFTIIHGKILKKIHTKIINLKYQLQRGIINLKHLADHILYQIFKIILSILKKHGEKTDNPSIRTYVNMIENRIIFKIKTGYLLELFNS